MARGAPRAVDFSADARQFVALLGRTSEMSAELKKQLRKELRAAAKTGADKAKSEVRRPPLRSGRRPRSRGLRAGIAKGIKVSIAAGATSSRVGVFIKSTGSGLAGSQKKLVKRWDSDKPFRHPVFGRGGWASQYGRPYFRKPLHELEPEIVQKVQAAVKQAAKTMERPL